MKQENAIEPISAYMLPRHYRGCSGVIIRLKDGTLATAILRELPPGGNIPIRRKGEVAYDVLNADEVIDVVADVDAVLEFYLEHND